MSKMGRPKSDNNKDKIVAVRLTEEEHQRLTMYAKKTFFENFRCTKEWIVRSA